MFPLEVRCATLLPCAIFAVGSDIWVCPMLCDSPPKTAPNEGMGVYVLDVVVRMLESCGDEAVQGEWAQEMLDQRL